jgi:hypothetical protein
MPSVQKNPDRTFLLMTLLILVSIILVAWAFFFGWPAYLKYEMHRNGEAHVIAYEHEDLQNLGHGLTFFCEFEKKDLLQSPSTNQSLSGAELYERLSQSKDALGMARPSEESISRRTFCDRWGNPIQGNVIRHGNKMHITLWSDGPNLRDEQGKGDDIIVEVDITSPQ